MAPLSASSMFQSFRLHFFSINSTGFTVPMPVIEPRSILFFPLFLTSFLSFSMLRIRFVAPWRFLSRGRGCIFLLLLFAFIAPS